MNKLEDTMIPKTFKCLVSKAKYESKCLHSFLHYNWHSNSLLNDVGIYLKNKFQLRGTFKVGKVF